MTYIAVKWKHTNPAYPVVLYSELDEQGWEQRKVEVFADGRHGYADRSESTAGTRLGVEAMPPLAEIASDPQFEPSEITRERFEEVWSDRRAS
jgi:hypothetical protein